MVLLLGIVAPIASNGSPSITIEQTALKDLIFHQEPLQERIDTLVINCLDLSESIAKQVEDYALGEMSTSGMLDLQEDVVKLIIKSEVLEYFVRLRDPDRSIYHKLSIHKLRAFYYQLTQEINEQDDINTITALRNWRSYNK